MICIYIYIYVISFCVWCLVLILSLPRSPDTSRSPIGNDHSRVVRPCQQSSLWMNAWIKLHLVITWSMDQAKVDDSWLLPQLSRQLWQCERCRITGSCFNGFCWDEIETCVLVSIRFQCRPLRKCLASFYQQRQSDLDAVWCSRLSRFCNLATHVSILFQVPAAQHLSRNARLIEICFLVHRFHISHCWGRWLCSAQRPKFGKSLASKSCNHHSILCR